MQLHPWLNDPRAVLISHVQPTEPVQWNDFRSAAWRILDAMQVKLDGEKVVIKPNGTVAERFADPDTGITTHPRFVQGMIEYLHTHGATRRRVFILEDPRNSDDNEPRHWRGTGFPEVAAQTGAQLRCPTTYTCVRKTVPHPHAHATLNVSRLAVVPDTVLINVPKLKTHNLGITTLCLKNLMGTVSVFERHFCAQAWREIPDEVRSESRPGEIALTRAVHEQWQEGLARRLADLAQIVQPQINVIEGVVGRDGTGFQNGKNYALGLAIAGINMVAVDSVASYLMGYDPQSLIYLKIATEAGPGINDIHMLSIYVVQENGSLAPCTDVDALRAQPPLHVINKVVDGQEKSMFADFIK
ncbi:MAG: DUF362 domain-containing protein [Anaerolineae bacterium]|nr:DUF362 domain-containing protein [Anaerolineae bacterium]